jgi:PAS domain S-box-containing protein
MNGATDNAASAQTPIEAAVTRTHIDTPAAVPPATLQAPLTAIEYRLLVEHSPVMIWRARLDKKCDYFNHTWLEFTGRTMDQEFGDGWAEGVHPDDLERCVGIYISNFDARRPFEMEYRLRRHDGVYRWIFDRGVPYTDDRGEFLGFIGSCVDVTERIDAEEHRRQLLAEQAAHAEAEKRNAELQELNQRVRASEKELRLREHRERFFAEVSQVMASHLEYSAALDAIADLLVPRVADFLFFDSLTSHGSIERIKWRHADESRAEWLDRMKETGFPSGPLHPSARVLRLRQVDFVPEVTEEWIRNTATSPAHADFLRELNPRSMLRFPLIDGEHLMGVLTLGTTEPGREFNEHDLALGSNIAARLVASLRNARLYSELQQAVRTRDEVTSIVSHDLKDPLHTIQMAASLLLDPELGAAEETRQQQLTMIRRCATRMARLLEDLLDVARAEASSLGVTPRPTPVAPLIEEVIDAFRLSSTDLGVALRASVPGELPLVAADDRRIVQVLTNLCANALKFTPRGGTVTVLAAPAGHTVRLSVMDTGVGIPRDNLGRVFDRFWQASRASRASAGLGLAIAKSIVEAHGGEIWVESTEGTGAQFHFTLPTASTE